MFTNAPYKICITVFVANVLVSSDNLIAKANKPKAQAGTLMFLSLLQLHCRGNNTLFIVLECVDTNKCYI